MTPQSSNKQIAKNTLFLYMRMLVSIVVNLYTVRVLWKVLGVDNYGIYNVVGGIVMMFAFLNSAMVASSQRFISYELGGGNRERLHKTFSISLTIHFLLAICILVLAETIGLWFLNEKMNIPEGRMPAANWVYQCSVATFLLTVISVPYNACIVAHEHMKVYGYFGILEVILKLVIVLIVALLPFDNLIVYAILVMCVAITMRLIYGIYCTRHFEECHFHKFKDKYLMKDMFSFAGWSFLGNMGFAVRDQGINIILNLFFGVAVNAAKGIASQVGGVINGFANSFTMAVNPQITKRFAAGETESMINLMMTGCKYSLLLMGMLVVPVVFCAETLLKLWIGDVAPYTVGFLQLTLILALIDCVVSPITTSIQATGKIKTFQVAISIIMIANLPLAWVALKIELNPYLVMFISLGTSVIALIIRLILLRKLIGFSMRNFIIRVYFHNVPVIVLASICAYFFSCFGGEGLWRMIIYGIGIVGVYTILAIRIGLDCKERHRLKKIIEEKFHIITKKV